MKTITLTLTEEQAQQLLQQLLDPNNGNAYRIETAAAQDEEPAASSDQPTTRAYTYKAMDPNGKWYKYISKPYIHDVPDNPQWVSSDCELDLCSPSEIPSEIPADWKDSLTPM